MLSWDEDRVNTPHLNPVSHQCRSGPRSRSGLPSLDNLNAIVGSSPSVAELKNVPLAPVLRRPAVTVGACLSRMQLYTPISAPVSIPYCPFHSSIIQSLPS